MYDLQSMQWIPAVALRDRTMGRLHRAVAAGMVAAAPVEVQGV